MDREELLKQHGVQYKSVEKYWTRCPSCADTRKKKNTASLRVNLTKGVYLKCLNEGCDLEKGKMIESEGMHTVQRYNCEPITLDPQAPSGSDIYSYTDSSGQVLMLVVRTPDKQFYSFIQSGDSLLCQATDRPLMYWASRSGSKVIVCEGEKAADACAKLFPSVSVVTWPGGAKGVQRGDWSQIEGMDIVIWPDNDSDGMNAAKEIQSRVGGRVLDVSNLPPKSDAADVDRATALKLFSSLSPKDSIDGEYDIEDYQNYVSSYKSGPSFGYDNMKNVLLPSNGVVIVSGRSGHGKSTSMLNFAYNFLLEGRTVVFYSMELTQEQVIEKMCNIHESRTEGRVYYQPRSLGTGYEWIKERMRLRQFKLVGLRTGLEKIIKTVSRADYDGSIVMLDYIQIVPTQGGDVARYRELQHQVYALKDCATKNNITFFLGSQLTPGDTGPDSDKARESADINNVADLHIKIWNKPAAAASGAYKIKREKDGTESEVAYYDKIEGDVVVSVIKNRWGPSGQKFGFNLFSGCSLHVVDKNTEKLSSMVDTGF